MVREILRLRWLHVVAALFLAATASAQVAPAGGGAVSSATTTGTTSSATTQVQAAAALVTCPPKPPADPCEQLTCKAGEWVSSFKARGSKCGPSGDPCAYGGTCSGTSFFCSNQTTYFCNPIGPCWSAACNGTGGCIDTPLPAGTATSACTARGPCDTPACNGSGSCGYPKPVGTPCGYHSEETSRPNPCGDTCDGWSYRCGP